MYWILVLNWSSNQKTPPKKVQDNKTSQKNSTKYLQKSLYPFFSMFCKSLKGLEYFQRYSTMVNIILIPKTDKETTIKEN